MTADFEIFKTMGITRGDCGNYTPIHRLFSKQLWQSLEYSTGSVVGQVNIYVHKLPRVLAGVRSCGAMEFEAAMHSPIPVRIILPVVSKDFSRQLCT